MARIAGRYELKSQLGAGNYGTTYLARDQHKPSQPYCVVKQLHHRAPKILRLFEQEAVMLEKLGQHPQIPALIAYFTEGKRFYIVQEYIDGYNLRQEIQPGKKLSQDYVLELLQDVLNVLNFVHQNRVIHRDIKPENLVRRRTDGRICLIDFGTVKELSQSEFDGRGKLHTTITVGTSGYMPIEQKRGKPCLGSDLYALGMVAIEALTGILAKDLAIAPDTLEPQWQGQVMVAASLAEFIDRLTQWQASHRPHSAQDALRQLPVSVPQTEDASGHCGPALTAIANHSRNNANRATAIKEETLIQNTLYVENSKGTQTGQNLTAIRSGLALGPRFLTPILARISGPPSPSQTIEAMAHVQENLTDVVSPAAQELTTLPAVVEPRKLPVKPIAMGVGVLLSCLVIWGLGIKIAERWERWERPQITIGFNQLRYPEVAVQELVCIYKDCEIEGRLRPAAFNAFWQMWSAARQEGIQLYPIGSFQSVEGQRDALAGLPKSQIQRQIHFSDYHTGYGLALGDAQVPEANWQMTFETTAAYQWLQANAADFGFELSYPAGNAAGMEPEPWHWRYVGDSDSQAMFGTN